MADTLPTIWDAQPHTLAKHAILRRYLEPWFPILTRQASRRTHRSGVPANREILFVDGFAGPGEYSNGKEGSPVIALKAALNHTIPFPVPVRMLFIEQRPDRFQHLTTVLDRYIEQVKRST